MSALDYQVYQANVFKLAHTLVVKYAPAAAVINTSLFLQGLTNTPSPVDPTTFKYYMNMMGQKHPTDPTIQINIIDPALFDQAQFPNVNPFVPMDFTIANLAAHPATEKEYYYGSYFYNQLLGQYPNNEALLLGVIYPITNMTITDLINVEDGTIVNYASELVEPNETNLIPSLQEWIYNFLATYVIQDYGLVDDLYVASVLGIMFSHIPKVIMNIRLRNCHTIYAHSYHITEYLNSNGDIGQYVPYMTLAQKLALYRNIRYVFRNPGTQNTFKWLVDTVMTGQNIPLAGYDLRHNVGGMPDSLTPTVDMYRFPINFDQSGIDVYLNSIDSIVTEEAALGFKQDADISGISQRIFDQMSTARVNKLPTKVLESSVYDATDSVAYPLMDVLMSYWPYLAVNNQFNATVYVTNPVDGSPIIMSPLDAFILNIYCYVYANCIQADGTRYMLDAIPQVLAKNIINETAPSFNSLANSVDSTLVTTAMIDQVLAGDVPVTASFVDVDIFYTAMTAVQAQLMSNRLLYATQEDFRTRGYMEFIVNQLYKDVLLTLAPTNTTYASWLVSKGLDFSQFQPSDHMKLSKDLITASIGIGTSVSVSLGQIQSAMIGVMASLCSYNVQFLQNINGVAEIIIDAPQPRMGYINDMMMDEIDSGLIGQPIGVKTSMSDSITLDIIGNQLENEPEIYQHDSYSADTSVDVSAVSSVFEVVNLDIFRVSVSISDFDGTGNPPAYPPMSPP